MKKDAKDLVADLKQGRVTRRDFVERAAVGGMSLFATADSQSKCNRLP